METQENKDIFYLDNEKKLVDNNLLDYFNFSIDYADKHIHGISKLDYKEYKIFDISDFRIDNRKRYCDNVLVKNGNFILVIGR